MFDFGLGALYRGAKSFLNPGKGYEKAQNQLNKYYNESQGYLQPYNQHGQEAYGNLNTAMQSLMNPSQLYDQFLGNYEQSDASKYAQGNAMNNGLDMLASMGMLGSTPGLQSLQAGASQIGAQDQQRYMEQMINQYLQGAGLAQNIYGQGASAAGQMGQNAANMGNNSAEMAFGKQNAPGQMFGNLLGTGANLAGSFMGMNGANNMSGAWKTGR